MSLATAATYRDEFKNKMLQQHTSITINTYKIVMYMQRSHRFYNIHTPDDVRWSDRKY